jgi:RNA polymerase sigma-70 factor (ECF subfamily)
MNAEMAQIECGDTAQDRLYAAASAAYAPAIARLARAVEADSDRARDIEQDMHLALWRSLATYDGRCALGTWTYRVIHNIAATHATRAKRGARLVSLDGAETLLAADDPETIADQTRLLARLHGLIAALKPTDRSVILLYLEGIDASTIAEVVGLSPGNVAVKVHRIKALLASHFATGTPA